MDKGQSDDRPESLPESRLTFFIKS